MQTYHNKYCPCSLSPAPQPQGNLANSPQGCYLKRFCLHSDNFARCWNNDDNVWKKKSLHEQCHGWSHHHYLDLLSTMLMCWITKWVKPSLIPWVLKLSCFSHFRIVWILAVSRRSCKNYLIPNLVYLRNVEHFCIASLHIYKPNHFQAKSNEERWKT